jgi:opacity protein-like surface antigen
MHLIFKKLLLVFILISTSLSAEKLPWEFGVFGSGIIANGILGDYWKSNLGFGAEILYPFHKRVPVILSGQISSHKAESTPPQRDGFHKSEYDLLLFQATLLGHFVFREDKKIQPYLGSGLGYSIFIAYQDLPPESNSGESEYGVTFSGGVQLSPNKKVRLFSDYKFSTVFTSPHVLYYGVVRAGIRFSIIKRENKDEL